ncbi:SIS domain-containing protein [Desulfosudis oleivorans]|uniref:Glutamine--fructose-6-phosphate aminotransferase [isomerizing] n=1 Tax=Desulfosudis oleivorans (strain DSM 6200 / JCM 39069 / Hxd3) TaxID=96561 RepID=A9A085_DESOH|nr:SIS domain-containing protein [Desulfosudis oleivorans]ABW69004.1 Glutamine--fructose-6-phosphate transaminase (isomerizing) [Desulfosudis oleivorans Hxd3]
MCGIVAIVPFQNGAGPAPVVDVSVLQDMVDRVRETTLDRMIEAGGFSADRYLGGDAVCDALAKAARDLKTDAAFFHLYAHADAAKAVCDLGIGFRGLIDAEADAMDRQAGQMEAAVAAAAFDRLETLRDICWCLETEVCDNVKKVGALAGGRNLSFSAACLVRKINTTFNSLDRLEVRGRDSAGISVMAVLDAPAFDRFSASLAQAGLDKEFAQRTNPRILSNRSVALSRTGLKAPVCLAFVYKVAAEIGSLGDNVRFLREQIQGDSLFWRLLESPVRHCTLSAHTRWASVGTITEANCHPQDSRTTDREPPDHPVIQVCLNGDIDNFQELKAEYESSNNPVPEEITTDTKIIALRVQVHLEQGHDIESAFRLAVNDFKGSHAISMQTSLAPGKMFFAQKGSGQALFLGLAPDHYIVSSELYGIVEETADFVKMNANGSGTAGSGQIVILDGAGSGGVGGVKTLCYDGTPVAVVAHQALTTDITSRDVDRQGYSHYFLKEISEAPAAIEKTLYNRWKTVDGGQGLEVALEKASLPPALCRAMADGTIRRIFFIGQGTAGVAALACAGILEYYLADPSMGVRALKASELSGLDMMEHAGTDTLADTLVCAISQSGTTTDTNRAVDMVKKRGAHTLAIVNRRDSDITFKVDGVIYTSTGRDIEMSVASTKAFYSQVVAGALLGLALARIRGARDGEFITSEIKQMLRLPACLRRIFTRRDAISACADRLASARTYWAVVGSGPNKAAADEIRIKLSELCYKTISSDYVEDKKHIDLSAEPLIIVCAAGSRSRVLEDIVKDTAIFKAHKAVPIVITDEGEERFAPYAEAVIPVPQVAEHFGPIVNTFAGHLWGYYAALAINKGARLLHEFRETVRGDITAYMQKGLDLFEILLENGFREKIARFYTVFRSRRHDADCPAAISLASDLALLLKYLSGRLPFSDFELDFGKKGTAPNMIDTLFEYLGRSINHMARPVDAIKHQAKTVTVGTSRTKETMEGILFETLAGFDLHISQLTNTNIVVLRNVQLIVSEIKGAILYKVDHLNLLGEPTDETTIAIIKKTGVLAEIPSRVESDKRLKGTKKIIVREGNVYIGKGRKDDRHIVVIPVLSASPARGGMIRFILLLNIGFRKEATLFEKKKALGGKAERIKNIVQESSVVWQDSFLEQVDIQDLFGKSAEKIAESIVTAVEKNSE